MPVKILSVDDSKTVRIIINKAFKMFDAVVVEAANGVEGLSAATKERPDIVLLDITMPVMDGVEMLTRLKADPGLKAIPVIMLTAEGGREQVLKIAKLGVRDYIVKPFKEDTLVEKVGKVVELKAKDNVAQKARTIFDPVNILVVDEKPAIVQQIQEGLKHTPWKIIGAGSTGEAVDHLSKTQLDAIVVSLNLAEDGGLTLFRMARQTPKTKNCPVLGLAVKTDVDLHQKAFQAGVTQIVTKPIDLADLEAKLTRSLNLDTSPKYFSTVDGVLVVRFPAGPTPIHLAEISGFLKAKVGEAVNTGVSSVIVDLHDVKTMDMGAIKLVMQCIELFKELSLTHALYGNSQIASDCRGFEDTSSWHFAYTIDDARKVFTQAKA